VRRRRVIIILAVCVLAVICFVAFWPGEREPTYNGKKLSEWLALQNDHPEEVEVAVRAIGTNALPVLTECVEFQLPAWRLRLLKLYPKLPSPLFRSSIASIIAGDKQQVRAFNSVFGFRLLGTNASSAAPELIRFLTDKRNQGRETVSLALAYVGGPDSLPPLLAAVQDKTTPDIQRALVARAISHLNYRGPDLSNAVPVMITCLQESNRFVPSLAATALGTFLLQPDQSVPALTRALESSDYRVRRNAIRSLGKFGLQATNALNAISNSLNDSRQDVRTQATNALRQIVPEKNF
jgi:HEAT repeat protein